jgi:hypothetical protein
METAMKLTGVDEAYFVLDDYWTNSKKISTLAEAEADAYFAIDGGKDMVFYYTTKNGCYE